jgi:hypothetical protein
MQCGFSDQFSYRPCSSSARGHSQNPMEKLPQYRSPTSSNYITIGVNNGLIPTAISLLSKVQFVLSKLGEFQETKKHIWMSAIDVGH